MAPYKDKKQKPLKKDKIKYFWLYKFLSKQIAHLQHIFISLNYIKPRHKQELHKIRIASNKQENKKKKFQTCLDKNFLFVIYYLNILFIKTWYKRNFSY